MTKLTITAPDPRFAGARAGVVFRDGRGEVDPDDARALAYFERHGYAVDTVPRATRKELLARAAELGLEIPARSSVAEIAEAIAAAEAPDEADV